ncbi:hypothetical protein Y1Q_0017744 [Alligator mississippiensis]|uniref:Uncharacterized protein n=1 Tax=Alligator mississippiensis TaxID=8496 RepID=A0A151P556_ALLMI|nr:hypothetical protein Y1Q_0017744 [Alligator mississippiensis]
MAPGCLGALMGVGDVVSQQLVEQKGLRRHSGRRTLRMMAIGFCFVLLPLHPAALGLCTGSCLPAPSCCGAPQLAAFAVVSGWEQC